MNQPEEGFFIMKLLTYQIAMVAGQDAANRQMEREGRVFWNSNDNNLAREVFERLWPTQKEQEIEVYREMSQYRVNFVLQTEDGETKFRCFPYAESKAKAIRKVLDRYVEENIEIISIVEIEENNEN